MAAIAAGNPISGYDGTTQYSYEDLDKNGDGIIDAITIIYKNTTQTNISVQWGDPLWDYHEKDPGVSSGYLYKDANGNAIISLGKVVHETAHIFGLGDLYNPKS